MLVSNKIFLFGEKHYKYFISYLYDDYKIQLLHIMLPKKRAYVKRFHGQAKCMYFLLEDEDLFKKYNTIWDKVSKVFKKD